MVSTPSRALTSTDSFDERLRNIFSFRAAIPLIDEYLSSIQIDDDDPAFLFDWQEDNVNAFVAAANGLNPAQAPRWLRTRPPQITASSVVDDVVHRLQPPQAGGRFGHIMLAPNNQQQYGAILVTLGSLQNDAFLQNAAQLALPVVNNVERYLAVTAHLADSRVLNARPNTLPQSLHNGEPGMAPPQDISSMTRAWTDLIDPFVSSDSRWHSSHVGLVATADGLGDSIVSRLRDGAREPSDQTLQSNSIQSRWQRKVVKKHEKDHTTTFSTAGIYSCCGRELLSRVAGYEKESRLLIKLADTGRVVTLLLQKLQTLVEILTIRDVAIVTQWEQTLEREREARMELYDVLLSNDEALKAEMGDERQQLEILTLLKDGFEIYGSALSKREERVISEAYELIVRRSGFVVGCIPSWFATRECTRPGAAKSPIGDEEQCLRQVASWSALNHPHVRRLYGACHVGKPFAIHENCQKIAEVGVTWKLLLGCALGLRFMHERGCVHNNVSVATFMKPLGENKGVLSGLELVKVAEVEGAHDFQNPYYLCDVLAFGLAAFELLVMRRSHKGAGVQTSARYKHVGHLPTTKPPFLRDDEWKLLRAMCAPISSERLSVANVVHRIETLCQYDDGSVIVKSAHFSGSSATAIDKLTEHEWTSGSSATESFPQHVGPEFTEQFGSVYARLEDIHRQLITLSGLIPTSILDAFNTIMNGIVKNADDLDLTKSSILPDFHSTVAGNLLACFHCEVDTFMNQFPEFIHTNETHNWRAVRNEMFRHQLDVISKWVKLDENEQADSTNGEAILHMHKLGRHFLQELVERERSAKNAVALNFLRHEVEKKLNSYSSISRVLVRLADTGHIVQYLQRAISTALGIFNLQSLKSSWYDVLKVERDECVIFYENLLENSEGLKLEMGDFHQKLWLQTLLRHAFSKYEDVLSPRELDVTAAIYDQLVYDSDMVVAAFPPWFATSEDGWSFARRSFIQGDGEGFIRQVELWTRLNHPNVRKLYGACHVGLRLYAIHDDSSQVSSTTFANSTSEWSIFLEYAHALQYVHSRRLVHMSFTLNNLHVTWDRKIVLSGVGLVRLEDAHLTRGTSEGNVSNSMGPGNLIALDVRAFGAVIFEVLGIARIPTGHKPHLHLAKHFSNGIGRMAWTPMVGMCIEDSPAKTEFLRVVRTMTEAEWNLLKMMCDANLSERTSLADVIRRMEDLVEEDDVSQAIVRSKSQLITREDLHAYVYPTSGNTLRKMLNGIDDLYNKIAKFKDVNLPVIERLKDIYVQLENVQNSLPCFVLEDFCDIIYRFSNRLDDRLDECEFGGSFLMAKSAAHTVADRNHSLHHQLDELLWNSGVLDSSAAVHQWRKSTKMLHRVGAILEEDGQPESIDRFEWLLPADEVQIGKRISSGSFGTAYLGKWLGTDVVVKKVLTNQDEVRNRIQFRREAELWFPLNHANLIKLYGTCEENSKQPAFVCEQAVHGTLSSFLTGKSREERWGALYSAAYGLQHLHDRGIIHGDLKGNNVLVCSHNLVKLADFGLSVVATQKQSSVEKGMIGAIRWKAPECICGSQPTFASDIYSFGMCIVEAMTNKFPWGNMRDPVVESFVVRHKKLPPRSDEFTDEEWELVTRMCSFQPRDRIDVGAVVCLMYQLLSGSDFPIQGEFRAGAERRDLFALQRYRAFRYRADILANSAMLKWFIPLCEVELKKRIVRVGFTEMFTAFWLNARVVVKQLMHIVADQSMYMNDDALLVKVFRREAKMWSVLNHPNIAKLYGVGYSSYMEPYFVCEEAINGSLDSYVKQKPNEIWRCLHEAARGIQYLHERGIIHNDIKCKNILVCASGAVKLTSFGLSTLVGSPIAGLTLSDSVRWKAPEITEGKPPSLASDIYSFGMCIIEAMSGKNPWGRVPDATVQHRVERGELPRRSRAFNDHEWELVVRMCLFDPDSRIGIDSVICCIANFR